MLADVSLLERVSPRTKLSILFCSSVLLFLTTSLPVLGAVAGVTLIGCLMFYRIALVQWIKAWPLHLTMGTVVVWKVLAGSHHEALVLLGRLGTLSLIATVVTVTTTTMQFIETVNRLTVPLERLGLANAQDIGLSIGLVMRLIPDLRQCYLAIVNAHRARGLALRPFTIIVPMIVQMLKRADDIAIAIDARGIRSRRAGN